MPWLDAVGVALEAWYPGQRGGEAIARLLFGAVNPSGKPPIIFPASMGARLEVEIEPARLALPVVRKTEVSYRGVLSVFIRVHLWPGKVLHLRPTGKTYWPQMNTDEHR